MTKDETKRFSIQSGPNIDGLRITDNSTDSRIATCYTTENAEFVCAALNSFLDKNQQTIELDCAPGTPRPDSYIDSVIKDTGLPSREPVSKFFGNWMWVYNDIPAEQWERVRATLKERITALYNAGRIRYGSW